MSVDYGRGEHMQLPASRDAASRCLADGGYEFVANAFRPGAGPKGVRTKDADTLATRLREDGYQVEVATAYNETGDALPSMASIWRKPKA
jgi:hypothetical protein